MFTQTRGQALALFLTLLVAGTGYGQVGFGTPAGMPAPAFPSASPADPPVAAPPPLWKCGPDIPPASIWPLAGAGGCGCGPAACIPYEDRNGPLLVGDPLLDNPPGAPGWLLGVELAGVVPHVENKLFQPVTLSDGVTTDTVQLPAADLGMRVMPRVELGYRFGQAAGEVLLSYHFVVADGTQLLPGLATNAPVPASATTPASLRSRLDVQVLDVDYGSYEPSLGPQWDMKWRVGVRGLMFYADSQAANGLVSQQVTDRYWGIGPHAVLDLRRWIGHSDFAIFGRGEVGMVWGRMVQGYYEDVAPLAGETRLFQNTQAVTVGFQAGATWTPERSEHFRLTAGYIYEAFIDVGTIAVGVAPRDAHDQRRLPAGRVELLTKPQGESASPGGASPPGLADSPWGLAATCFRAAAFLPCQGHPGDASQPEVGMKGDPQVLDGLNWALTVELTAINQYFCQAKMCKNWGFTKLAAKHYEESMGEMKHAEMLIDRILFLEGTPEIARYDVIKVGTDIPEQFKNDLALEMKGVQQYNALIDLCVRIKDNGTRELVAPILVESEEHVDWLETQLGLIDAVGLQNYLTEQMGEESE